jgi:hypothetical protein
VAVRIRTASTVCFAVTGPLPLALSSMTRWRRIRSRQHGVGELVALHELVPRFLLVLNHPHRRNTSESSRSPLELSGHDLARGQQSVGVCSSAAKKRTSIRNGENERAARGKTALDARRRSAPIFVGHHAAPVCADGASVAVRTRTPDII